MSPPRVVLSDPLYSRPLLVVLHPIGAAVVVTGTPVVDPALAVVVSMGCEKDIFHACRIASLLHWGLNLIRPVMLSSLGASLSRSLKISLSLPTLKTARRPFIYLVGYLNKWKKLVSRKAITLNMGKIDVFCRPCILAVIQYKSVNPLRGLVNFGRWTGRSNRINFLNVQVCYLSGDQSSIKRYISGLIKKLGFVQFPSEVNRTFMYQQSCSWL